MRTVGNILWHFPFFGFLVAAVTFLVGVIFVATVVAAPLGLGLIEFSKFLMAPFSYAMVTKKDLEIEQNKAWEAWSLVITILYFPLGLIAVAFNVIRIAMLCLTIIGIPIAIVAAKSLGTYLNPVNKKCVPVAVALELERRRDRAVVEQRLGGATSEPVPKRVESAPTAAVVPVDHGPAVQLSAPGAAQPEPVALSTSPRTAAELAIAEARAAAAPTDPSAQRAFAELLQRTGNSQALVQWHKVAILDPDDAAALEALVALSADDSQRADALRNFAGYVAAHPGDRAARAKLAWAYWRAGDLAATQATAVGLDPTASPLAPRVLARLAQHRGEFLPAAKFALTAMHHAAEPDDAAIFEQSCRQAEPSAQLLTLALEAYGAEPTLAPRPGSGLTETPEITLWIDDLLTLQGRKAPALARLKVALSIWPKDAKLHLRRAALLEKNSRDDEFASAVTDLLDLDSNEPTATLLDAALDRALAGKLSSKTLERLAIAAGDENIDDPSVAAKVPLVRATVPSLATQDRSAAAQKEQAERKRRAGLFALVALAAVCAFLFLRSELKSNAEATRLVSEAAALLATDPAKAHAMAAAALLIRPSDPEAGRLERAAASIETGTFRDFGRRWERESSSDELGHADAVRYCSDLDLGFTDWRLPNQAELRALYTGFRDGNIDSTLNTSPFGVFWTSYVDSAGSAWSVHFEDGRDDYHTATAQVRCVRE